MEGLVLKTTEEKEMNTKDYYRLLEIHRDATENDIKKAYRKLAMVFHPDVNTSKDAEEKFKKISEAYAVLSDSHKRLVYDQTGNTDFSETNTMRNQRIYRRRGMGRCMGKCSGLDSLFRKRPRKRSTASETFLN